MFDETDHGPLFKDICVKQSVAVPHLKHQQLGFVSQQAMFI